MTTEPTKVKCIEFPPEMCDGEHRCIIAVDERDGLALTLAGWVDSAEAGDEATIKIVLKTRKDLKELPEI